MNAGDLNVTETIMDGKYYKVGDKVPSAGRYQCVVCGFIVEFAQHHIDRGVAFPTCSVCHAGSVGGAKDPEEDVWKAI